ncbi:MAG: Mov34/MPN/PAD-1 family protein [Actinomycetota bacterium]
MSGRLVIPAHIHEAMVKDCFAGLPNEACGFLGGRDGAVERLYPLTNAAASPLIYRPADREMLEAINDMDDHGVEVVSIYHSHVASRAYPSPTDIREAHYPDAVYLIVSLEDRENPVARGYLIRKKDWREEAGEVEEVELVIS